MKKKNGTALSPGQRAEFLSTGVKQLVLLSHDPKLDPVTADSWARNGEGFKRVLRRELIPQHSSETLAKGVVKIARIQIGGGRTTDQIVEATKAKDKIICINSNISQKNMSSGYGNLRFVVVEFFEFDHDPTTEEVVACCQEPGYGHSSYEDGLRFQEDRPNDQRERPHIFIPENPWFDPGGYPQALYLWSDDSDRELYLVVCHLGYRWGQRCLFARRKYLL